MLRLDVLDEQNELFEVSLIVGHDHNRRGFGKAAVEASKSLIERGTILAEVIPGNAASSKIFVAQGFKTYEHAKSGTWFYFSVPENTELLANNT